MNIWLCCECCMDCRWMPVRCWLSYVMKSLSICQPPKNWFCIIPHSMYALNYLHLFSNILNSSINLNFRKIRSNTQNAHIDTVTRQRWSVRRTCDVCVCARYCKQFHWLFYFDYVFESYVRITICFSFDFERAAQYRREKIYNFFSIGRTSVVVAVLTHSPTNFTVSQSSAIECSHNHRHCRVPIFKLNCTHHNNSQEKCRCHCWPPSQPIRNCNNISMRMARKSTSKLYSKVMQVVSINTGKCDIAVWWHRQCKLSKYLPTKQENIKLFCITLSVRKA